MKQISRDNTVGLIIDIQEKLFPHMAEKESLIKKCECIINGLKVLDIPLLVTQQYTKGLGATVQEIDKALGNYTAIEKINFSCCGEPAFMKELEETGKINVVIAGIETHVCVLQTTLDLLNLGYQPVVLEDCVSSRYLNDKKTAIERIRSEGAIVSTSESILFELLGKAGTEEFKMISKLVK